MKTKYILNSNLWQTATLKPRSGETPWQARHRAEGQRRARKFLLGIAGEILTAVGLVVFGYIMAVFTLSL
jgi:hypothetical protein